MVSMTGFGRCQRRGRLGVVTVEARSVNHRYLEVSCRLPEGWTALEDPVRALAEQRIRRGKVTVTVNRQGAGPTSTMIHLEAARQHLAMLRRLQRLLKLPGPITLEHLTTLPGVLVTMTDPVSTARSLVLEATRAALDQLVQARRREGQALARALRQLVQRLTRATEALGRRAPQVVVEYRRRLAERIQALTTQPLDPGRLEQEVALFAKECDITEELTRIRAHVAHLQSLLKTAAPAGRTMDFVAQELHREVNTVGSKANDVEVSRLSIQMKGWVEQLREQAQNLE